MAARQTPLSVSRKLMEAAFVKAFLTGPSRGNGAEAARIAGYSGTPKSLRVMGSRLLHRMSVQRELSRFMQKDDASIRRWVAETERIAYADIRDVVSWENGAVTIRDSRDLSEDAARAISEVTEESRTIPGGRDRAPVVERRLKVKLHQKLGALELLGKYLKVALPAQPESAQASGDTYHITVVQIAESRTALEGRMARLAARLGAGGVPIGDAGAGAGAPPLRLDVLGAGEPAAAAGHVADVGDDGRPRLGEDADGRGVRPEASRNGHGDAHRPGERHGG